MQMIDIELIQADEDAQPRSEFSPEIVADYAEAMLEGDEFPPITLFNEEGTYWLADGFHRLAAARAAEYEEINADVRIGTKRDAILFASGANATHGWRRSNQDKRRAVLKLLNDWEWFQWSDREIARRCRVSDRFVNSIRATVTANIRRCDKRKAIRNGVEYEIETSGINADRNSNQQEIPENIPEAPETKENVENFPQLENRDKCPTLTEPDKTNWPTYNPSTDSWNNKPSGNEWQAVRRRQDARLAFTDILNQINEHEQALIELSEVPKDNFSEEFWRAYEAGFAALENIVNKWSNRNGT